MRFRMIKNVIDIVCKFKRRRRERDEKGIYVHLRLSLIEALIKIFSR
jgi:hypothetical protein